MRNLTNEHSMRECENEEFCVYGDWYEINHHLPFELLYNYEIIGRKGRKREKK